MRMPFYRRCVIKTFIISCVLFAGLSGSFLSMLSLTLRDVASGILFPSQVRWFGEGFLLMFNRLFVISEQQQRYQYIMFDVMMPMAYWPGYMMTAVLTVLILFAVLGFIAVHFKPLCLMLMLPVVCMSVYLGVFASAWWYVVLFGAFAAVLLNKECFGLRKSVKIWASSFVIILLLSPAVFVIFPPQNIQLYRWSESLRDWFGPPLTVQSSTLHNAQTIPPDTEYHDVEIAEVQDQALYNMPLMDFNIEEEYRAQGAEIGFILSDVSLVYAVVFVIFVLLMAIIIKLRKPFIQAIKRRRLLADEENPDILHHWYQHMWTWLHFLGLGDKNINYIDYAHDIKLIMSHEYAQDYEIVTLLWQKFIYGHHVLHAAERKQIKAFLEQTKTMVWQRVCIKTKIKIKLVHFM